MATEILKSFTVLQSELEEARSSLKGVDENIKRLIGRDPSEVHIRPGQKRPLDDKNARPGMKTMRRGAENDFEKDAPPKRRNPNSVSVFKRLSDKVYEDPIKSQPRGLISKVIAAPKEVPSRQEMLDKQNKDEKFKARNRRMFGALLGTLQKFQQEESKLKKKEEKRTQIEKKIEEHEQQEKEEIKKERQELFLNRRKKQQEIKMIELKMLRMKEYAAWEETQKPRTHFIVTKTKPHIHYLPRKMNDKTRELLEKSKKDIEEQIERRRQAVCEELGHIEERVKKNFDIKTGTTETKEVSMDRHDRHPHNSESEDEFDTDLKMKSLDGEDDHKNEENQPSENKEETCVNMEESAQDQVGVLADNNEPNADQNASTEANNHVTVTDSNTLVNNNFQINDESEESNANAGNESLNNMDTENGQNEVCEAVPAAAVDDLSYQNI